MEEKSINILHVDDDKDYSDIMGFWLKSRGHSVMSVSSGREALDSLKKNVPDIVLLDIDMPEMDGLETLHKIRVLNDTLPVVMVTAYASKERLNKAKFLNASGFFNKSDDFTEAAGLIQKLLTDIKQ